MPTSAICSYAKATHIARLQCIGEPDYVAYWRRQPVIAMPDNEGMPLERLTRTQNIVHIADLRTERAYPHNPRMIALVDKARARTFVAVPMLKDDELIGAIAMYRQASPVYR